MRRSITMLMAALVAVGMLASFAGPVAAHDTEAENEIEIDNEIDQEQTNVQASNQEGSAAAYYGDASVNQYNEQNSEQTQVAVNNNEVDAKQLAAAFSA